MLTVLLSSALHANFTLFDMAKDSMFIARGEFTSLERTKIGDRMTLRCDEVIKGSLNEGEEVTLEAFEPAPADEGLGREVIVCFNRINGQFYFVNHPFAWRSFVFETEDVAADGLDRNEQALRNFLAINAPHQATIEAELRRRLELESMAYPGKFEQSLLDAWKAELLNQVSWAGTRAARDAAKALVEHQLFKGTLSVSEIERVGALLPASAPGEIERAYMLELVRNQNSAHPAFNLQVEMLMQETSQACVGKLSNLMLAVEDRQMVLERVGTLAADRSQAPQVRVNALQILEALKDTDGLAWVHQAVTGELEAQDFNKDVMRRALRALRSTPDASNVPVLDLCISNPIFVESWELTQRAWIAYAMVDSDETNAKLFSKFMSAESRGLKFFFQKLLPENKIIRKLMIVHKED
ncbi:MAG: hypothetical protein H6840_00485 [Planctomycetes bacterium]|nr:hypothetical protein [Planctomycetota bacterium]